MDLAHALQGEHQQPLQAEDFPNLTHSRDG
jgi:hypothetical protein